MKQIANIHTVNDEFEFLKLFTNRITNAALIAPFVNSPSTLNTQDLAFVQNFNIRISYEERPEEGRNNYICHIVAALLCTQAPWAQ